MFQYTRSNHFGKLIEKSSSGLDEKMIMNGYISKGTINELMMHLFTKISDAFNKYCKKINTPQKNFFNYNFVASQIIYYLMHDSIMSEDTIKILSSLSSQSIHSTKNTTKRAMMLYMWENMMEDDSMDEWVYEFLIKKAE